MFPIFIIFSFCLRFIHRLQNKGNGNIDMSLTALEVMDALHRICRYVQSVHLANDYQRLAKQ